jgi:hypothetical protein
LVRRFAGVVDAVAVLRGGVGDVVVADVVDLEAARGDIKRDEIVIATSPSRSWLGRRLRYCFVVDERV